MASRDHNLRFYEAAWRSAVVVPPHHWPVHRTIRPHLRGQVLEIGPGAFPHSHIPDTTWLEPSPLAASQLCRSGRRCVVGQMEAMPFDEGSFDTALALDVLEHCEDDRAALAEVARVLRPRGTFLLAVPLGMRYWSRLDALVGHTLRYEPRELLHALEEAGLVPEHARWILPVSVLTKRLGDELQYLAVRAVGIDRATSLKAAMAFCLPLGELGGALAPFSGAIPEAASRILLACRRV